MMQQPQETPESMNDSVETLLDKTLQKFNDMSEDKNIFKTNFEQKASNIKAFKDEVVTPKVEQIKIILNEIKEAASSHLMSDGDHGFISQNLVSCIDELL